MSANTYIPFSIVLVYVVAMLVVGFWAKRGYNMEKLENWGLAGRKVSPFVFYFLMAGGVISAYTFMGAPGLAYAEGAPILYVVIYLSLQAVCLTYYFGPKVCSVTEKLNYVTQAETFGARYESYFIRAFSTIVTSVGLISYAVLQTVGCAYIITLVTGGYVPHWLAVYISLSIMSVYVYTSGLRAIGFTNVLQSILMLIVAWIVGLTITHSLTGSWWFGEITSRVLKEFPEHAVLPGAKGIWSLQFWVTSILVSVVSIWPNWWMWWASTESPDRLKYGAKSLPTYYLVVLPMIMLGLLGLFYIEPGELASADHVVIVMGMRYGSPVVVGLLYAAILAAALSSAAPMFHTTAFGYAYDIVAPLLKYEPEKTNKLARILIFPLMFALVGPISVAQPAMLVYILLFGYAFIAQVFSLVIGVFWWPRATKAGATAGLVVGSIVAIYCTVPGLNPHPYGIHGGIWGLAINILVFLTVSLATKPNDKVVISKFFSS